MKLVWSNKRAEKKTWRRLAVKWSWIVDLHGRMSLRLITKQINLEIKYHISEIPVCSILIRFQARFFDRFWIELSDTVAR